MNGNNRKKKKTDKRIQHASGRHFITALVMKQLSDATDIIVQFFFIRCMVTHHRQQQFTSDSTSTDVYLVSVQMGKTTRGQDFVDHQ